MTARIVVRAVWDEDARALVATSDDVKGLALEAESFEQLTEKVVPAIEELIELNGLSTELREIPVEIRAEQHARFLNPLP